MSNIYFACTLNTCKMCVNKTVIKTINDYFISNCLLLNSLKAKFRIGVNINKLYAVRNRPIDNYSPHIRLSY